MQEAGGCAHHAALRDAAGGGARGGGAPGGGCAEVVLCAGDVAEELPADLRRPPDTADMLRCCVVVWFAAGGAWAEAVEWRCTARLSQGVGGESDVESPVRAGRVAAVGARMRRAALAGGEGGGALEGAGGRAGVGLR